MFTKLGQSVGMDNEEMGYAISKQLPRMQSIITDYGSIDLQDDDELKEVVRGAIELIFEKRMQKNRKEKK